MLGVHTRSCGYQSWVDVCLLLLIYSFNKHVWGTGCGPNIVGRVGMQRESVVMPGLEEVCLCCEKGIYTPLHSGPAQASRVVCAESPYGGLQGCGLGVRSLRKSSWSPNSSQKQGLNILESPNYT